jgi:hypothetical protein
MPRIRRTNLPPALLLHLLERIRSRGIQADQLRLLAEWLDTEPEVPAGRWFKRFPGMIACGEGDLVRTFLIPAKCQTVPKSSDPGEYGGSLSSLQGSLCAREAGGDNAMAAEERIPTESRRYHCNNSGATARSD